MNKVAVLLLVLAICLGCTNANDNKFELHDKQDDRVIASSGTRLSCCGQIITLLLPIAVMNLVLF